MNLIGFLILFPLVPALLLAVISNQAVRAWVVNLSVAAIAAATIALTYVYMGGQAVFFNFDPSWVDQVLLIGEGILTLYPSLELQEHQKERSLDSRPSYHPGGAYCLYRICDRPRPRGEHPLCR